MERGGKVGLGGSPPKDSQPASQPLSVHDVGGGDKDGKGEEGPETAAGATDSCVRSTVRCRWIEVALGRGSQCGWGCVCLGIRFVLYSPWAPSAFRWRRIRWR